MTRDPIFLDKKMMFQSSNEIEIWRELAGGCRSSLPCLISNPSAHSNRSLPPRETGPDLELQLSSRHNSDRPRLLPIGSMYAIYGNIYHQYTPNVSIYTIHGSYGLWIHQPRSRQMHDLFSEFPGHS